MRTIIADFKTYGGKHCVTNSLKQVFEYNGFPLSEEMLFGIGSGFGFTYLNLSSSPMVSGRIKVFEFEEKLAARLGIKIACKTTKDCNKAFDRTKAIIGRGQPVFAYADMPYLEYMNLDKNSHFGGHSIIIFGYDDEKEVFYVSDRDSSDNPIHTPKGKISEDYHLVPYKQMELARSSSFRPFPVNNKWIEFDFSSSVPVTAEIILEAVRETCDSMLKPPVNFLGVNGIRKFSGEVLKWKRFEDRKLRLAGITNYFMINADGGTGGGAFRDMFGRFLLEANERFTINGFKRAGEQYIAVAGKWERIADIFWKLSQTGDVKILEEAASIAEEIGNEEALILGGLC